MKGHKSVVLCGGLAAGLNARLMVLVCMIDERQPGARCSCGTRATPPWEMAGEEETLLMMAQKQAFSSHDTTTSANIGLQ